MSFISSASGSSSDSDRNTQSTNRHLPLSALASWSQKNFDATVLPTFPGFTELRSNAKRKGSNVHLQEITALVTAASDGTVPKEEIRKPREKTIQLCLSDVEGSEYVAECLIKRMYTQVESTVLRTLDLLDHLMRKVPYFYRYVANKRFFTLFWNLVEPLVTGKPQCDCSLLKRREYIMSRNVANRVLFLIRAWAEEFEPVVGPPRPLDSAAMYIIEQFEKRSIELVFPEIPPGRVPYVYSVQRPR